jgi:arabinose-5-phosphate isomerase
MSRDVARQVFEIEAQAILGLRDRLDGAFERALELLLGCAGRVVVTGLGKSGLIGQKISATFASTGTPSLFLHPVEALHGDLGRIVKGDVVLAVSYSGESPELLALLAALRRLAVPLVSLTGNKHSTLATQSDAHLDVGVRQEACPLGLAPTASTTAALAMGDALAMTLLVRKGFRQEDFASLHPGGKLGRRLMRVEHVMHAGDAAPVVRASTPMHDVFHEMSSKRLGMTCVVHDDSARLAGIFTDGDLRRLMLARPGEVLALTAGDVMKPNPRTIRRDMLAVEALKMMETHKITSVVVTDDSGTVEGVVHLHDLWRTQMF